MPTFEKAPDEVAELIDKIMGKYHKGLEEVDCNVTAWFAHAEIDELTGKPKGCALKWAGYEAAAVIKVCSLKQRVQKLGDAEMTIDGDRWDDWTDEQKAALIDHELTHLEVVRDGNGLIKKDDIGRPKLKVRLHDWQVGGFAEVVERHGKDAFDYTTVQAMVSSYGQLLFPWAPEVETASVGIRPSKAVLEATRDLCPKEGGSISKVTISTPGSKPVTLTSKTRANIDRMLKHDKKGAIERMKRYRGKAPPKEKPTITTGDGRKITSKQMGKEIDQKFLHG